MAKGKVITLDLTKTPTGRKLASAALQAGAVPFVPRRGQVKPPSGDPDPVLKMKVSFVMQFGCTKPTPAFVRALMHAMLIGGGLSQRAADTLTVEEVK